MPATPAQRAAAKKYKKKAVRRLTVDFPIPEYESAKKYADENGTTVTGLIRQLLREKVKEN